MPSTYEFPQLPDSLLAIAVFPNEERYEYVRANDYKKGSPALVFFAPDE